MQRPAGESPPWPQQQLQQPWQASTGHLSQSWQPSPGLPGPQLSAGHFEVDPRLAAAASKDRFAALETLRGVAALAVTVLHLGDVFLAPKPWTSSRRPALHLSVDFFLVLSGFVLSHSYTYSAKGYRPVHVFGYRVARLWPMNMVALGMMLLVLNLMRRPEEDQWDLRQAGVVLLHVFMCHMNMSPNLPSWTVCCEFWISVVFAFVVTEATPTFLVLACATLGQVALLLQYGTLDVYMPSFWHVINSGFVRCGSSFALGIIAYRLYRWGKTLPSLGNEILEGLLVTIAELLMLLSVIYVGSQPFPYSDFLAPWIFLAVVVCFAWEAGGVSGILSWFSFLGTISYSVYLTHWPILNCLSRIEAVDFGRGWGGSLLMATVQLWIVLLPLSSITYYAVEQPCNQLLRRLWDQLLKTFELEQNPGTSSSYGGSSTGGYSGMTLPAAKWEADVSSQASTAYPGHQAHGYAGHKTNGVHSSAIPAWEGSPALAGMLPRKQLQGWQLPMCC